jgi:uncharacterized protein DUF4398
MQGRLVAIGAVAGALVSCGGVQYTVVSSAASSRLEEARALGADRLAPYDYYFAKEHLEQAQIEASHASYSDAVVLAKEAQVHASAAIESIRKPEQEPP